jgi:hypothetical protein
VQQNPGSNIAELVDLYFGEAIQVVSADDGEGMDGKFYRVCDLLGNGYQNLINHIVAIGSPASTWKQHLILQKRSDKKPRQSTLPFEEKYMIDLKRLTTG